MSVNGQMRPEPVRRARFDKASCARPKGSRISDADVIVVGAGPAGSATATHLARHGLARLAAGEEPVSHERRSAATVSPRAAPGS